MIGVLIGLVATLLAAFWAVALWPLRAYLRRRRDDRTEESSAPTSQRLITGTTMTAIEIIQQASGPTVMGMLAGGISNRPVLVHFSPRAIGADRQRSGPRRD